MQCPKCKFEIKPRSNKQNRYYWPVVVGTIADHTGHTPQEIHEILRAQFLPAYQVKIGEHEYIISKSTTELTTVEMENYLSRIRSWASTELGCYIQEPNEEIIKC